MNQMGYLTHPYGSYHSLAQVGGMGGAMMTSQMAVMGQQPSGTMGVHQNSMMGTQGVMASPYMTGMSHGMAAQQQSGMMGQQQIGIMGQQQVGAPPHPQAYGVQHAQQLQWNVGQVGVKNVASRFSFVEAAVDNGLCRVFPR